AVQDGVVIVGINIQRSLTRAVFELVLDVRSNEKSHTDEENYWYRPAKLLKPRQKRRIKNQGESQRVHSSVVVMIGQVRHEEDPHNARSSDKRHPFAHLRILSPNEEYDRNCGEDYDRVNEG